MKYWQMQEIVCIKESKRFMPKNMYVNASYFLLTPTSLRKPILIIERRFL